MLAFISTELQKPFVRLFFAEREEDKAFLAAALTRRFDWIATRIEGTYLFGDHFSASDAFLYVMLRWAAMCGLTVPAALQRLAGRIETRPAVRKVLAGEAVEPLGMAA